MPRQLTCHVISHTHWDRAWYCTFEQTRACLLDIMDDLLDLLQRDEGYRHFVLDGQLAMVQDYLALRPERRPQLEQMVADGRLSLGPMFVLPDLYIPAGESLVRNLRQGLAAAADIGPVMRLGYLPDPFGHPAQLPQVLRGFGIQGMMLARGVGDEGEQLGADFLWEAPDGSRVHVTHHLGGYANLEQLGYLGRAPGASLEDTAVQTTRREVDKLAPHCPTGILLLNNGCDHRPAQHDLPRLMRVVNRRLPGVRLRHSTPEAYQRAVRRAMKRGGLEPKVFAGELRGGRYANLLPGVLSARVDLKLRLHACETELLRWAEPWSALTRALGLWRDDRALLDHAWRLLLLCQPHDDICGCSVDLVHDEDHNNMSRSEQVSAEVRDRAMAALARRLPPGGPRAMVFNPHPWPLRAVVRLDARHATGKGAWTAGDGALPSQRARHGGLNMRASDASLFRNADENYNPNKCPGPRDTYLVQIDLPALGYSSVTRQPGRAVACEGAVSVREDAGGVTLRNELVEVRAGGSGKLRLRDLRTGLTFSGLAGLRDEGDAGDTYDFSPPARQRVVRKPAAAPRLRVRARGPLLVEVELSARLRLPVGLTKKRRARAARTRAVPLRMVVSLRAGSPVVQLEVTVRNTVEDHRLQLCFPTPLDAGEVWAGAPFEVLSRPVEVPRRPDWFQPPYGIQPFSDFCAVEDPRGGLALLAPGLHEYEARRADRGAEVRLTLLRSVSWLARDDLSTRRDLAGPAFQVSGARQLGEHAFRLAMVPYQGTWSDAGIPRVCQEHAAEPRVVPDTIAGHAPLGREIVTPANDPATSCAQLPLAAGLLHLEPRQVVLSSLSPGPDRTVEARLVNLSAQPVTARLRSPLFAGKAERLDLSGATLRKKVALEKIALGSWEILTLRLRG